MTPPRPHHPPPPIPSSAISAFIDASRIDALLAPWVADPGDRAFVVRCLLGEGPAHHRGANYVLLALLGLLVEKTGGPVSFRETLPVAMRLPPHLARDEEDGQYPLRLPVDPLERLAPRASRDFAAMVDCLTDGPPQHALANAAMLHLIGALLARAEEKEPPK